MKRLFAIFLLASFTTATFGNNFIILDFEINQSYLAANKCINRSRPQMHCNGKCVLAKKWREQEKQDSSNPERKLAGKDEVASSRSFFVSKISCMVTSRSIEFGYILSAIVDRSFPIFHPPAA